MQRNRRGLKPRTWIILCAALVGGLMQGGCESKTSVAQPAGTPLPEVAVLEIQPERIVLMTELPGRTAAYLVAEVRPQVNGILQDRLFDEGADVEAGQLLYQIDPAPFEAAMENAEANLVAARKAADQARAALNASVADVSRYETTLKLAKLNRERFEELVKDRAVSAIQRDQAVTDAEVAEAALQVAKAQVIRNQEAIGAAEAAILQAEAARKTAAINLAYTKITAPISGRIGRSEVTKGSLMTAYQPIALATIQQINPIYVDVTQSTTELLRLRRLFEEGHLNEDGDNQKKIQLILEDGTPYAIDGTLQFRDITVDPTTGSYILRVVFENPDGVLLPGMFVRAVAREGVKDDALLIPQQAISRDPKGNPYALVVEEGNKVASRPLTIDRAYGDSWLVGSGLKAGDRIIVQGMQRVRPGAEVRVVPFVEEAGKANAVAPSAPQSE
ncbi:MAG: efflux RND transporter periplasmic adaptor subunit [bacterium]|jgi:membrane fusion protein (multidrug efflux system)|nr:efflux RND transporter periplasmic adaptor subunit [bacterium]